jgi:uncharacterized protein (UPF0335 family)
MTLGRNTISGEALRGVIERVENIDLQKKQLTDDRGAVLAEAKASGFVPACINAVVRLRKLKPSVRQEAETLLDSYLHAMGEATDTPLFRAVGLMKVDITSREQVIDAMKKFVPSSGSITIDAGGAPVRLTRDADGNVAVTEVVEKPIEMPKPSSGAPKGSKPKADIPDVDGDGAEAYGRQMFKDDIPIIKNPFPFGDPRRARCDEGWRRESGGDGMGPDGDE